MQIQYLNYILLMIFNYAYTHAHIYTQLNYRVYECTRMYISKGYLCKFYMINFM